MGYVVLSRIGVTPQIRSDQISSCYISSSHTRLSRGHAACCAAQGIEWVSDSTGIPIGKP